MTVRVTCTLQVLIAALCPLVPLASTSYMTPVLFLWILTALDSPRSSHGTSNCARELCLPRFLPIIHQHSLIELIQLDHLVDRISLIREITSLRAAYRRGSLLLQLFFSLMIDDSVLSILVGTARL